MRTIVATLVLSTALLLPLSLGLAGAQSTPGPSQVKYSDVLCVAAAEPTRGFNALMNDRNALVADAIAQGILAMKAYDDCATASLVAGKSESMNYARLTAAQLAIVIGRLHVAIGEYRAGRAAFADAISRIDKVTEWGDIRPDISPFNKVNMPATVAVDTSKPPKSQFYQEALNIRVTARRELSQLDRFLAHPAK